MRPAVLIAVLAAAVLAIGCNLPDEDAGPVRTEDRTVAPFERIEVDGRTDVTVRRGPRQSLLLRGGDLLLEDVTTTVAGGTLRIDRDGRFGARLTVTITVPRLRGLDAESAGEIELLDVDADALELHNDGAGEVRASGRVGMLRASLGGVGAFELANLTAARAIVRVGGVGDAEVTVRDDLDARVTGVGSIEYHGDPTVRSDVSGLGDVKPADS